MDIDRSAFIPAGLQDGSEYYVCREVEYPADAPDGTWRIRLTVRREADNSFVRYARSEDINLRFVDMTHGAKVSS